MESDIEYLKRIRREMRLSQEVFAHQLGYTPNYIAVVEMGKRPLSQNLIKQIEIVFKIKRD